MVNMIQDNMKGNATIMDYNMLKVSNNILYKSNTANNTFLISKNIL